MQRDPRVTRPRFASTSSARPATARRQAMGRPSRRGDQPRWRRRATYTRPLGVRHPLAGYDLTRDWLYGHIKTRTGRVEFLAFCRYLRSLYPPEVASPSCSVPPPTADSLRALSRPKD